MNLVHIPYVPLQIDESDLMPNGLLITDAQLAELSQFHSLHSQYPNGRYTKGFFAAQSPALQTLQYALILHDKAWYVVYHGKQKNKSLGEGTFGTVKLIQNIKTKQFYALKIIKSTNFKLTNFRLNYYTKMIHKEENGLRLAEQYLYHYERLNKNKELQTEFIMPLVPGVEMDVIFRDSKVTLPIAITMMINSYQALQNLHDKNVLHRDMKQYNVICDSAGAVRLVDFGFTVGCAESSRLHYEDKEIVGTEGFLSPEIMHSQRGHHTYSNKSDVFALSVAWRETVSQAKLFECDPIYQSLTELLKKACDINPSKRPTAGAMKQALKEIQTCVMPFKSKSHRILFVTIDFLEANPGCISGLMEYAKSAESLQLCDTVEREMVWVKWKRKFNESNLIVNPDVIVSNRGELMHDIELFLTNRRERELTVDQPFLIMDVNADPAINDLSHAWIKMISASELTNATLTSASNQMKRRVSGMIISNADLTMLLNVLIAQRDVLTSIDQPLENEQVVQLNDLVAKLDGQIESFKLVKTNPHLMTYEQAFNQISKLVLHFQPSNIIARSLQFRTILFAKPFEKALQSSEKALQKTQSFLIQRYGRH